MMLRLRRKWRRPVAEVAMECPDDGDRFTPFNRVRIGCRFWFGFVGTIGNGLWA